MEGYRFDGTIGDMFDEIGSTYHNNEAIVWGNDRIKYRVYANKVNNLSKGLLKIGVKKSDKISILMANYPEWLYSIFAIAKVGGIIVPINTRYKTTELKYILEHSESTTLIMMDEFLNIDYLQMLEEICPEIIHCQPGKVKSENLPSLQNVIILGRKKFPGSFSFGEILSMGIDNSLDSELRTIQVSLDPNDVANIVYTSGTTGDPKGAMLTHRGIINNAFNCGEIQKLTDRDRMLIHVPLFTVFGCVNAVNAATSHGATIILTPHFDAKQSLQIIQKEKVTSVYNVPTMLTMLLESINMSNYDLSSLRTGLIGGAPLAESLLFETFEKMGIKKLTVGYGLTETCAISTQTRIGDSGELMSKTVGRPMPGLEIKCVDAKTGKDLSFGQQGEICIRGFNIMKGYFKNLKETAKAINEEGWFFSGDLGTLEENGYVTITGRKKDMIISGGFNVYPSELEDYLFKHPKVKQVQVIGVYDEKMGEVPVAFIEVKEGMKCSEEEISAFCRGRIANYKIPKYVRFISSFPMTASGKIKKFKLREMVEKEKIGKKL